MTKLFSILISPIILWVFLLFPSSAQSQQAIYKLDYSVNRSQLPPLNYHDLTYLVKINQSSQVVVHANNSVVNHTYNSSTDQITFTTNANQFTLYFTNPSSTTNLGQFQKAVLKDNRGFALSLGFDDNFYIENTMTAMESYGYTGTLFLIGDKVIQDECCSEDPNSPCVIDDWSCTLEWHAPKCSCFQVNDCNNSGSGTDTWCVNEDIPTNEFIISFTEAIRALEKGWALGNHGWGSQSSCDRSMSVDQAINQEIMPQDAQLKKIISFSNRPNYIPIAQAAPCFLGIYNDTIPILKNTQQTTLLFNETGTWADHSSPFTVDPGHFDVNLTDLDRKGLYKDSSPTAQDVIQIINQMASTYQSTNAHQWHNLFLHGRGEVEVNTVLSHVYHAYGAGNSINNIAWVAPSENIFSYIFNRDHSTTTHNNITQVSTIPTVSPAPSPTITTSPVNSPSPQPSSSPTPKPGDANGDRVVNLFDYNLIIQFFGQTYSGGADLNKDGVVNLFDYNQVIQYFGS